MSRNQTKNARRTLRRWVARANAAAQSGLTASAGLTDRRRPSTAWSRPGAEAAWRLWLANYLRREKPTAVGCWKVAQHVGATRGWQIPSVQAFLRRLRAEARH